MDEYAIRRLIDAAEHTRRGARAWRIEPGMYRVTQPVGKDHHVTVHLVHGTRRIHLTCDCEAGEHRRTEPVPCWAAGAVVRRMLREGTIRLNADARPIDPNVSTPPSPTAAA